jgi:hypothetical protein
MTFDDFDLLACNVMTLVALEGQCMATQRKIADLLRVSASPAVVSPPLFPHDGRSKNPHAVHESRMGEEFEKERT